MSKFWDLIKKWWPSILPAITALWAVYGDQIQTFVAAHAKLAAVVAALYSILTHTMTAPKNAAVVAEAKAEEKV